MADIEPLLVLHLLVVVVAFGVAAGFSLAHRFWPGLVISVGAIVSEVMIAFTGYSVFAIAIHQPLTVMFSYFIIRAGERDDLLKAVDSAEGRCHHAEAELLELQARTSGDLAR